MSSSLGYSLIEGFEKTNKNLSKNNKTRRNKITRESLSNNVPETTVTAFSTEQEEEEEDTFSPENYPDRNVISAGSERLDMNKEESNENENEPQSLPVSNENISSSYKNFPPEMTTDTYYTDNNNNNTNEGFDNAMDSEGELMQKLNYMIRLLEEQHDDKIKSVTEEVILFGFIGVFIIYVVDSFAKVGKYVR